MKLYAKYGLNNLFKQCFCLLGVANEKVFMLVVAILDFGRYRTKEHYFDCLRGQNHSK
jgi:hypothetical protein